MLILIADDNAIDRALTNKLLKNRLPGVNTIEVSDGCAMLNTLESNLNSKRSLPELILVELYMPGFDGWKAIQELKENPGLKSVPVVFLSRTKNPKNYLLASRLNTPLFMKGEGLTGHAKAINDIIMWYSSLAKPGNIGVTL